MVIQKLSESETQNNSLNNDTQKDILLKEKQKQDLDKFKENEINWTEEDYFDNWDKIKGYCKNLWGDKKEYLNEIPKWFFLAHDKDTIIGKPQLIESMKMRIPLVRCSVKKVKQETGEYEIRKFHFFDDKFDKRYDGYQAGAFALDFYKYVIQTSDDKRFYILTQEKLPNETCTFKGMAIELADWNELSKTMKLPSISRIFFVKEFEPDVKIISKEELIKFTKEKDISEEDWFNFLAIHKFGTINNFCMETELLRSAFILSGKVDNYPLHLAIMGQAGTRKTMGHGEALAYKFTENEEDILIDSGNSRLKGLIPSYKGVVTKLGFLIGSERIGIIDEIGKLVEDEMNRHDQSGTNILGNCNPILEHKHRKVTSGNTDDCSTLATAKFLFLTNPIGSKALISDHINIFDPSTMSRILWWVQDKEEIKMALGEDGVIRNSPRDTANTTLIEKDVEKPPETLVSIYKSYVENRKGSIGLSQSRGKICSSNSSSISNSIGNRCEFLTLFDTCYSFCSEINDKEVMKIVNTTTNLSKEPMKTSVWSPRAYHHVKLLIDGLCKHRSLFKDYDSSFVAKQEDYDLAERILIRMVLGWNTNLSLKKEFEVTSAGVFK